MSATLEAPQRATAPEPPETLAPQTRPAPARLVSLDAYRGFIMLAMASGGLGFAQFATRLDANVLGAGTVGLLGTPSGPLLSASSLVPDRSNVLPASQLWGFLGYQFDHVPWIGCSFWDLIQPSFIFMVGVALPYSLASRRSRGERYGWMFAHAVWRALLLILLAVFLSSPAREGPVTNWVFVNVLAQIGLGYVFVFLLVGQGLRVQSLALFAILAGTTIAFYLYPAPPPDFDFASVGGPGDLFPLTGWFAHWEKNTNVFHAFDTWFLNVFPRAREFFFNSGGYQTLNFIPSMATMLFGVMAGELLRSERSRGAKLLWLVVAGLACLAVGWVMGQTVSPLVKRIWTPSWAVFSTGWTFLILAAFFAVIDGIGWKGWAFPLVVVGMNSIAMYVMAQLLKPWIARSLRVHVGAEAFSGPYGGILMATATLLVLWLFCWWMYRRKLFLRI